MLAMPIRKPLKLVAFAALSLLLVSCSTSRSPQQKSTSGVRAMPGLDVNRAHKDGAPWWDVDVSRIPDATPTLHTGPYKANPYTVLGKTYFPIQESKNYVASGTASWYGTKFHGQNTANGEVYDLYGMSAAHKTLPLPSYVKVTNLDNNRSVILRVNDRGPFYSDRIIDLSYAAAKKLGYAETGTARVKVEGIDPQQWWAQRGRPAPLMLNEPQVAQNSAPVITASAGTVEQWTPPPQQHAAAVVPVQVKNTPAAASGQYLQVGAFANPDAAELLRSKLSSMVSAPVFISSIVRNQQTLHRVRLGPFGTPGEAQQAQNSVRLANLGQPSVVTAE
ncbi:MULTISPECIES: septal ring lytic transglycosylase RlpA family protein [Pseudomonas]|uniref:Endolytic peptidoglycan transglycosylase RlpA n=1 Tax=Pseudomonas idahonensis TaxID=2942628 RepID=A0ABT5QCK3_9PSED|nr:MULTISPECIES: septal ring lytic transglycosylase RlpA family protein [Pseudomonas]MBW8356194.1 septal ring lytic transglycosylase RlpA family protein [Pseudomonas sp.]MCY7262504.1 septal ring lytic transglycosylase RlpA family protein [Pseudomonas protegens]MDC7816968.1 septal ring lytic transglycosylase RlpA family protein [Pseudomonas sp. BLCC-B112]MDD1151937.1 septal ring lytic transglycosylase RlpA family protein [Pseudomonas idahonensis]MDP9506540.1 septal ring lytic transglycosylase R